MVSGVLQGDGVTAKRRRHYRRRRAQGDGVLQGDSVLQGDGVLRVMACSR